MEGERCDSLERKLERMSINEKHKKKLKELGIVKEENLCELELAKTKYYEEKFSTEELTFIVTLTYSCNLACEYCYQSHFITRKTYNVINRIIKFIRKECLEKCPKRIILVMYGGEPLTAKNEMFHLHNAITSNVSPEIKKIVGITSNLTLLDESIIEELEKIDAQVEFLTTLAGNQEYHDLKRPLKNGRGTYNQVLKGLKLLRDSSFDITIRIDVDEETVNNLDDLMEDLDKLSLKDKALIRVRPILHGFENATCSITSTSSLTVTKVAEKFAEKEFTVSDLVPLRERFYWCPQQTAHCYTIDPVGDLYTCYLGLGDQNQKVGSIGRDGRPKFNTSYYHWISRDPFSIQECRNCKFLPPCLGGCGYLAWRAKGNHQTAPCDDDRKIAFGRSIKRELMGETNFY